MAQTIELDCAPGYPRPGDLIGQVIAGLNLPEREAVAKFFGCWVWDYSDIPADHWQRIKSTLRERITALHDEGTIRYGSW